MTSLRGAISQTSGETPVNKTSHKLLSYSDPGFLSSLVTEAEKHFISGYTEDDVLKQFLKHHRFFSDPFQNAFTDKAAAFGLYFQVKDEVSTPRIDLESRIIKKKEILAAVGSLASKYPILYDAADLLRQQLSLSDVNNVDLLLQRVRTLKLDQAYYDFAKECNIPIEIMQQVVFPAAISVQASRLYDFMQYYLKEFPRLNGLIDEKEEAKTVRSTRRFFQFYDSRFPTYDANQITDTNLIAAAGPQDEKDVELLLDNTAFNKENPVNDIVVVGNIFKESAPFSEMFDFVNYFLFEEGETRRFGKYEITVADASDNHLKLLPMMNSENEMDFSTRSARIVLNVKVAGANEKPKKLVVNFFKTIDNTSLDLNNDDDFSRLFALYKMVQKKEKNILVHCASGVGRTGHLILGLLLTKTLEDSQNLNPAEISVLVLKLLNKIRKDRPAAVCTIEQFRVAVQTAIQIHRHERDLSTRHSFSIYGSRSGSKSNLSDAKAATPKNAPEKKSEIKPTTTATPKVETPPAVAKPKSLLDGVNLDLNYFPPAQKKATPQMATRQTQFRRN